ncbi:phloem protein 2 A5 [Striga asiatica]|uniref:Phloem protein 2 A5 n=1 Tax=Striga asiatica TaxID=4170 RepID=A0A5A7PPD4_STRAF|nr:phloem protein 2 A5 [Striga asiatica]
MAPKTRARNRAVDQLEFGGNISSERNLSQWRPFLKAAGWVDIPYRGSTRVAAGRGRWFVLPVGSGADRDAIVARANVRVGDSNSGGHVHVNAVGVRAVGRGPYLHICELDILTTLHKNVEKLGVVREKWSTKI